MVGKDGKITSGKLHNHLPSAECFSFPDCPMNAEGLRLRGVYLKQQIEEARAKCR